MKHYIITNEQLNKLMWLCAAATLDDVDKKDIDKQIERLCLDIKNNELNQEFPIWGRPMNAQ